jgi:hypothetical protein
VLGGRSSHLVISIWLVIGSQLCPLKLSRRRTICSPTNFIRDSNSSEKFPMVTNMHLLINQHCLALAHTPPSNIITNSSGHKFTSSKYMFHGFWCD